MASELDEAIEGLTPAGIGAIPDTEKAAADGVATLDSDGKVPAVQLPAMNYDPAGSAAAVKNSLDSHTAAANPHSGSVPSSRTVAGKPLTGNITLAAADVGARAINWMPTAVEVGAIPHNEKAMASGVATLDTDGRIPKTQLPVSWNQMESQLAVLGSKVAFLMNGSVPFTAEASTMLFDSFWLVTAQDENFIVYNGVPIRFQVPCDTLGLGVITIYTRFLSYGGFDSSSGSTGNNEVYAVGSSPTSAPFVTASGASVGTLNIKKGTWVTAKFNSDKWIYS